MKRRDSYRLQRKRRTQRYMSNCLHVFAGISFISFFALGVTNVISAVKDKTQATSKLPDIILGAPINSTIAEYDSPRIK
jgi:hypothetical protein